MKRIPLIIAILILGVAGGAAWWLFGRKPPRHELVLYGDVDLRQVELAFNDSERIRKFYRRDMSFPNLEGVHSEKSL